MKKYANRYWRIARDWLGCRLLCIAGPLPESSETLIRIVVGLSPNIVRDLRRCAAEKSWSLDCYLDNTLLVTTRDGEPLITAELARFMGQLGEFLEIDTGTSQMLQEIAQAESRNIEHIIKDALEIYLLHRPSAEGARSC